jgi:glycosyltransferase involved in cell wall biosynthesis
MIVKNEEKNLAGCLDCLKAIADEIIIVDTGSADKTKEIAKQYTDKVYDFEWVEDFAAARNFAFSKATMDYIYSADADERLDTENQAKFLQLKEILLPEIEIVQMYYCNQLENNTIYSFDKEYRPKLYKRLREFVWREKIHEAVTLSPIVFDSDIEIIHKPHGNHGGRDLQIFAKMVADGEMISKRLREIYAKELFIAGCESDFERRKIFLKHGWKKRQMRMN